MHDGVKAAAAAQSIATMMMALGNVFKNNAVYDAMGDQAWMAEQQNEKIAELERNLATGQGTRGVQCTSR